MKKAGIVLMSAVMLFAFSALVSAQGMGNCPAMGKGMGMGMKCGMEGGKMAGPKMVLAMASELNLTAEQMEKLKKISADMPEKGDKMEEMMKDREALHAEMQKETPDEAKINAMIDKMAEKHKAAIKAKLKIKLAVDAVLTKEQKEILKKHMEDKKGKMGNCKGKMKDK